MMRRGMGEMRISSRFLGVLVAAAVWAYAGLSVASRPVANQAITPSVLDVAASRALAAID